MIDIYLVLAIILYKISPDDRCRDGNIFTFLIPYNYSKH